MKVFNQKKLAIFLLGMGGLPFIIGAALILLNIEPAFMPVSVRVVIHSYAVATSCFVAGIHWGIHLSKRSNNSIYLISSFLLLIAWLSLLVPGSTLGMAICTAVICILLVVEYSFSRERVTTAWFWRMRRAVSVLVMVALLLIIACSAST